MQPRSPAGEKPLRKNPAQRPSDLFRTGFRNRLLGRGWLALALLLFLALSSYQLGLPGLHYDEAREAGVNAMELLTGAPVTAFRDATLHAFGRAWPLMVQDYIGALNVYLALPFLALTGIGVPNLRFEALLLAVLGLLALERAVSEWWLLQHGSQERTAKAPVSLAGLLAVTMLIAAPSFVFWNRQGVFVTNATLPFTYAALWQLVSWLRTGRARGLILAAFSAGLALYAKLLAVWIVAPAGLLVLIWFARQRLRPSRVIEYGEVPVPGVSLRTLLAAGAAGLAPLLPFLLFNLQTRGTALHLGENLTRSYYGVNNLDLWANLPVRLEQLVRVLQGDHLWYLGGLHANPGAPWLAALLVGGGLLASKRRWTMAGPLLLLACAVAASLFTVSDLFVTHYAVLHPLLAGLAGLGAASIWANRRRLGRRASAAAPWLLAGVIAAWLVMDLTATVNYHRDLSRSGGLADHSDASYHLAYHLRYNGMGAPIALDWGMDATVRYLTEGAVRPIEIFGYDQLDAPDDGFASRLGLFLDNPDNVYLLRASSSEVFHGRREAFFTQARLTGRTPRLEATFTQRDGTPLFEIWRVQ